MADQSNIEWTDATLNPIRARNRTTGKVGWFCEHASPGCDGCYAEKMNVNTYFGNGLPYKATAFPELEIFLDEKMLTQPLRWQKPRRIFICSMTDLFGRFVTDEMIDRVFTMMWKAKHHTFQILTKRPERMLDHMKNPNTPKGKPLPNVWLGVSVENQQYADKRIPLLLQTPAAVRWLSIEPLLGQVDLAKWIALRCSHCGQLAGVGGGRLGGEGWRFAPGSFPEHLHRDDHDYPAITPPDSINWVVVGGESGTNARPMHPYWARTIRDQCVAADVPFFFKQFGEWAPRTFGEVIELPPPDGSSRLGCFKSDGKFAVGSSGSELQNMARVGKKAAGGRMLDGRTWDEMPGGLN